MRQERERGPAGKAPYFPRESRQKKIGGIWTIRLAVRPPLPQGRAGIGT